MLTMFANRNQTNETSWEKNVDNTVYGKRKKYSCCMITCISIGATLFFLIGLFQTVLVFGFARESSRNPILVMGPVFMGIGAMMYMAVIEMCISKHKKKKQVNNIATVEEDVQLDEKEREMIEQELGLPNNKNTIVLRADQLPAMLTLNQEDLQRLGPDSNGDVCLYVTCQAKPTSVPGEIPVPGELPVTHTGENVEAQALQASSPEGETTVQVAELNEAEPDDGEPANVVTSPAPDPDAIPDEILEMLDKVQDMYRNDTPAEVDLPEDGSDVLKEEESQTEAANAQKSDA